MTGTAMISLIGRPNVGKSTLLNAIIGEKIAIVSNKPQTTRNRICGILNQNTSQLVFMDTPGYHLPKNRLGDYMVDVVKSSISDVDVIVLLVEPIPNIGKQEEELLQQIRMSGCPTVLVINKIDTVDKDKLLEVIACYAHSFPFEEIVPLSAKTGENVKDFVMVCQNYVKPGPFLFPDDCNTDQPERKVIAEIIREKLLWNLNHEIPHGTAVEITKFSERENEIIDIEAIIYCEKSRHKGIIIGKHGDMLKKISTMARMDCEKFMGTKVYLQTWVKVKENWRDNMAMMTQMGYQTED